MVPEHSSSEGPQPNASERTSVPRLEPRVNSVASSLRQPSAIPQLVLVARTSATQLPLPSSSATTEQQSSPVFALPLSPRPGGPGGPDGHIAPPDLLPSASRSNSSFGSASSTPTPTPGSPASSTASRLLARATHKSQTAPPPLSQIPIIGGSYVSGSQIPQIPQVPSVLPSFASKIPTGPPIRSALPPKPPPPPLPQPVQQPLVETPASRPPTVVPVRKISTSERPTGLKLPAAHLPPPSSIPKPPSLNLTVETAAPPRATAETAALPGPLVPSRTAMLSPPTVSNVPQPPVPTKIPNAPAPLPPIPSTTVSAPPAVAGSKLPLPASSTANYEYLGELESSPRTTRAEPLLTRRSVSLTSGPSIPALTGASNPLPLTSIAKSRLERRGSSRRAPRSPVAAGGGGGAEDDVEISSCSSSEVDEEELGSVANASLLASLDNMSLHMTLSSTRDTGSAAATAAAAAEGTSGARPSSPRRRHSALTAHSHGGTHAEASVPPPPPRLTVSANVPTPASANSNANAGCVQPGLELEPEPVLENETVHVSVPPIPECAVNYPQADSGQCPQPLCISSNNTQPLPPPPRVPTRSLPPPPPVPPRPLRAALASNNSVVAPATTTIRSEGKSLMQRSFFLHDHLSIFAWVLRFTLASSDFVMAFTMHYCIYLVFTFTIYTVYFFLYCTYEYYNSLLLTLTLISELFAFLNFTYLHCASMKLYNNSAITTAIPITKL